MRDHYITMMLAGSETTPTVLGWAFHHIAADPAVERRLRREWHEVLGDRPVRQEDLPALTYTGQVVKEALRLYPPSVLMRRTHSEATVAGIAVPVGTDLLVSPYAMHRDPRLFPDPLTFDPARWESGRDALPKGAYAPFGEGNRRCIGERFAGLSMPIVLATVLRRWQLRPDTRHRVREIQSAHPHVDALPMFVGEVRVPSATA
jgi:cytochrome P450